MTKHTLIIRHLGLKDYTPVWHQMRDFTMHRDANTPDELWLLEHNPVFTQGTNGKPEHILNPGDIPIIQTDRGGQVTYHGPGQLIAYPLLSLKRYHLSISQLVTSLETLTVQLLAEYGISAKGDSSARGVYVGPAKIASIGLRVKKGCCYHGLALNVAMDITPFSHINPCGYPDLPVTQIKDTIPSIEISDIRANLIKYFRLLPSMADVHIKELY